MTHRGILTENKNKTLIRNAIKKILSKTKLDKIKANIEGFEAPSQFSKASGEGVYVPDITGLKAGEKYYYEVAIKNPEIEQTVSKWKLLSKMAEIKQGKFFLMVPRGNFAFVRRILDKYPIKAEVVKM